jgi:1-acyl-sn-glycerol-3-phosphate acyltransferase
MAHPKSYAISRALLRWLFAPFVRVRVVNREITARSEPYILAANHISHFDPLLLGVAARRKIDWMAMVELFENPLLGAWCRAVDAFPVDRSRADRTAVKTALARLAAGSNVGIFPEGGIRDGATSVLGGAEIRPGVGALAQLSGAPVLPAIILGTDRLYAPRAWLPGRRTPVWIAFGELLPCCPPGKQHREQFEHRVSEALRGLAEMLRQRFQLTEDDMPQPSTRRKGRE